jgi:hypothetical protein
MICLACRQRRHQECPRGTWCDCQHQPSPQAGQEQAHAESALSWVRQG